MTPNLGMIDRCVMALKSRSITLLAQDGPSLEVGWGDKRYTNSLPDSIGVDKNTEFEFARIILNVNNKGTHEIIEEYEAFILSEVKEERLKKRKELNS